MLIEYLFLKGKDELCSSEKEFVHFLSANVSSKVVKIIQSYVGVVNKMVWRL